MTVTRLRREMPAAEMDAWLGLWMVEQQEHEAAERRAKAAQRR